MATRVFLILGLFLSISILANESARLRLSGRVFPQVQVSVVASLSNGENTDDTYRIRSNMSSETYRVFFESSTSRRSMKSFRHLVIEAN